MYLTCEDCGPAILVTVSTTRFDTTTAIGMREILRDSVREDCDLYLFDLSKVTFMDSSGIGTLIGFVKYVGKHRRIELCGLTAPVRKVLRLTNLLNVFTIHQTVEDGLIAHRANRANPIG